MKKQVQNYPVPTVCPYCGARVVLISNAIVYGKEYGNGQCYKCTGCDAHVGVHDGTEIPCGLLADKELRDLRRRCHRIFDPVWQNSKYISRDQLYGRLANLLDIPAEECHFGWFDKDMLMRCMEIMSVSGWYVGVSWMKGAA